MFPSYPYNLTDKNIQFWSHYQNRDKEFEYHFFFSLIYHIHLSICLMGYLSAWDVLGPNAKTSFPVLTEITLSSKLLTSPGFELQNCVYRDQMCLVSKRSTFSFTAGTSLVCAIIRIFSLCAVITL